MCAVLPTLLPSFESNYTVDSEGEHAEEIGVIEDEQLFFFLSLSLSCANGYDSVEAKHTC